MRSERCVERDEGINTTYCTLLTLLVPSMHHRLGCHTQFNYTLSRACAFGQKNNH